MTSRKNTPFTTADQRAADIAKAIAHPARIAILRLLAERGTCICGEVVDDLPLSQSTVSQHLKALRETGLIRGNSDGPRSCYCLDLTALGQAAAAITGVMTEIRETAVGCDCEAVSQPDAQEDRQDARAAGTPAPKLAMIPSSPDADACGIDGCC